MSASNDPCLCCPDCGCALQLSVLTNGKHTAQCADSHNCRAGNWITQGNTAGEAADKFVQKCERFGYLTALESKIRELLESMPTT